MKRILSILALVLAAITLTATPAFADSDPISTTVDAISTVAGSNGKKTVVIETDDGSYILPEGMDAPEPDSSIVLYEKDGKVTSWHESTGKESRASRITKGKPKGSNVFGDDFSVIDGVFVVTLVITALVAFAALLAQDCLLGFFSIVLFGIGGVAIAMLSLFM